MYNFRKLISQTGKQLLAAKKNHFMRIFQSFFQKHVYNFLKFISQTVSA